MPSPPEYPTMSAVPVLRKSKTPDPSAPVGSAAGACDHCGDALAGLKPVRRRLDGHARVYCCQGCAFIAEQLHLARHVHVEGLVSVTDAAEPVASARTQFPVGGMVCAASTPGTRRSRCSIHCAQAAQTMPPTGNWVRADATGSAASVTDTSPSTCT